jgi:hypothetical protein
MRVPGIRKQKYLLPVTVRMMPFPQLGLILQSSLNPHSLDTICHQRELTLIVSEVQNTYCRALYS